MCWKKNYRIVFFCILLIIFVQVIFDKLLPRRPLNFKLNKFSDVIPNFKFSGCLCDSFYSHYNGGESFESTTCSRKSYSRGPGQKVISFSFYIVLGENGLFDSHRYFDGIIVNMRGVLKHYPGWIMRIYVDLDETHNITKKLCNYSCHDPVFSKILDICPIRNLGFSEKLQDLDVMQTFPMLWRFLPALDSQVDAFMSRDIDSQVSMRELAAVNEWQSKDCREPVHAMRDHYSHNVPLLGGMWGLFLTRNNARFRWLEAWKSLTEDKKVFSPRSSKGADQHLLKTHFWPWAQNNVIQHDSFWCSKYPYKSVGWPTKRNISVAGNFVGAVISENNKVDYKCPSKCRRNPNWEYC